LIILFDLDGTLIDSTEAILESFHHSFDFHNFVKQKDEDIKALIGYPLDIMFEKLGVQNSVVMDFVGVYKEHYRVIANQKTILLKNAKEALELCREFATLGIVTTKTALYSRELMDYFEMLHYFDVLIGREDVQNPKPHAEPILKALEKLDIKKREIWMIGDTKLDLIAAKNANVNSIAVLSGYDDEKTLKKFTNVIFNDVLEAAIYLQKRKN
jgi:phosphoglycolate phosphatase